ncbi:MAG: lysophospholipid acyltransferase family protein [Rhodothermales bacterium]
MRLVWALLTRTAYLHFKVGRLPKSDRVAYRAYRQMIGCRLLCRILGIEVRTEGNIPENGGMLVISNHFGVLDPLALATALPVAFVGKAEIRKWPLLGWVSAEHGLVFVHRGRPTTVSRFTDNVEMRLDSGINVLAFPEGTTSPDESILPFKTGVFASIAGSPGGGILPVYLAVDHVEGLPAIGSVRKRVVWADPELPFLRHCWDLIGLKKVGMTVRFGEVIAVGDRDRKELAQVTREAVESLRHGKGVAMISR